MANLLIHSRCFFLLQQRLIGYVAGSAVQCDFCRGVDEKTYWTSAFSSPIEVTRPLPKSHTYYARVSLNNIGLRTAWIFAVAMRPDSDADTSLLPLPGVCVRPDRFVLRPSQSRVRLLTVTIAIYKSSVLFTFFSFLGCRHFNFRSTTRNSSALL